MRRTRSKAETRRPVPAALLWLIFSALAPLLAIGCGSDEPVRAPMPTPLPTIGPSQIITLGDIDPDDPTSKIKRFTPLAQYLASHLNEFGITKGNVRIARNIEEMGGGSDRRGG